MFHAYINAMYREWLWKKGMEELLDVVKLIMEIIEKKHGCSVIGTLDIHIPEDKDDNS